MVPFLVVDFSTVSRRLAYRPPWYQRAQVQPLLSLAMDFLSGDKNQRGIIATNRPIDRLLS